ncbi:hypothetical protein B1R27_23490 [Streptomyces sp. GKU 895]|nr:hypothetical protein B1R27_23490 [Streptomyces sp. GKU 895]
MRGQASLLIQMLIRIRQIRQIETKCSSDEDASVKERRRSAGIRISYISGRKSEWYCTGDFDP